MEAEFRDLVGKTLTNIEISRNGNDEILFIVDENEKYKMYHQDDCCESVTIEDIVGDIDDLTNTPILKASEDTSDENGKKYDGYEAESFTWTFYNIATIKGSVTIRWYGSSNGYYSESVSFERI